MTRYEASTFDYIVVGTGPAGSVIAKKLTDDFRTSLLALEAGDNNSREKPVRDSLFAPPFILTDDFFPEYFWQGEGIPQVNVNDRTFHWTGGRTLGGGSSINNEQYVRPSPANMKQWENMLGPLWSPERETYQFAMLENYNGMTYHPHTRGSGGPLNIRQTPVHPTAMTEKIVTSIEQATGFSRILDYNDPNTPIGPFARWQLYQKPNGIRESADTAFLTQQVITEDGFGVGGRRLRVLYNSTALRILFNEEKRAIGVSFVKNGTCMRVYAQKKVIICAGINSPKLLMLSGIGPAKELQQANISVIYNNPNVGKHLTTHSVNTATFTTNPSDRALPKNDPFALYSGGAFLPDPTKGASYNRRGVQIIGQKAENNMLNIVFFLLEPRSRGYVKIQNNDPLKMVLADQGFLNDRADLESIKNIYQTYIKQIAERLFKIDSHYKLITPSIETINDERKLTSFIKDNLAPTHHVQGTLRMAPSPKNGAVNVLGEVFGVKDLIVAGDSIAPYASDGNTSAPAYFIGANIADQLLRTRKL